MKENRGGEKKKIKKKGKKNRIGGPSSSNTVIKPAALSGTQGNENQEQLPAVYDLRRTYTGHLQNIPP